MLTEPGVETVRRSVLRQRTYFAILALSLLGTFTALPASAQGILVGYWDPLYEEDVDERIPGPEQNDYLGLPITPAARMRAQSWDPELLTVMEHQCVPHPSTYGFRGVGSLRVWEDRDPETQKVTEIETWIAWQGQHRHIYMDNPPPHPPEYAAHTWQGFSVGKWEGDVLVVHTDQLKAGWVRRNGVALTDRASMVDRFFRHGNLLTHVSAVSDPVYLSEPLVRSNGFIYAENGVMIPYTCRPAVEIPRARGVIPSHLPGTNPLQDEFAIRHHVPVEAARGGAQTALPEYMEYMQTLPPNPPMPAEPKQ
jgi:hypothetical protein